MTLCILKVHFLSLKHHIFGSTMLLTWLTEFPKLALVQTQITDMSSSRMLFHTYLPTVSFWPSCWSLYPPLKKLAGPWTCIISHVSGFIPSCNHPGPPPSNVMNSWALGHILFPCIINLNSGYIAYYYYSLLFYDNFCCYYFIWSKNLSWLLLSLVRKKKSFVYSGSCDNVCWMSPERKYLCREKKKVMKFNILFYN